MRTSVFLTVHRGVKKKERRGNEINWSGRKGGGEREREREKVKTHTKQSAVHAAGMGIDSVPTGYKVWGLSFCSCALRRQWEDACMTENRLDWDWVREAEWRERDFIHSPYWYGCVKSSTCYENTGVRMDLQRPTSEIFRDDQCKHVGVNMNWECKGMWIEEFWITQHKVTHSVTR